jgi:hypothetical protein
MTVHVISRKRVRRLAEVWLEHRCRPFHGSIEIEGPIIRNVALGRPAVAFEGPARTVRFLYFQAPSRQFLPGKVAYF